MSKMSLSAILSVSNVVLRKWGSKIHQISPNRGFVTFGLIRPHICTNMSAKSYSTEPTYTVSFEQLKKLTNSKDACIVDVREPQELRDTGVIPNSINIPLGEIETAFKELSDEDFLKKYGRQKPSKDLELIFTCRMGIRSGQAQELTHRLGYKKVKNYLGGWVDWEEQINK